MTAESVGVELTNVYRNLRALQQQGILQMKAEHRGGPTFWRAQEALDAIDQFAERAGRRSAIQH